MQKTGFLFLLVVGFIGGGAMSVNAHDILGGLFSSSHTYRGSGNIISEDRDVPTFTKVEVALGVDVVINVGKPQKVTLSFDDNLIDKIRTKVRGGTLEIDTRNSFSTDGDCKIEISVQSLEGFSLSGSGNIEIHDLSNKEFELEISGSGDVILDGKSQTVFFELSGSGNIDGRKLIAEEATVEVAGSGDVLVFASKYLEASIAGSGDIRYYGDPEDVNSDVAGSGRIRKGR
jgi:hypothetical protein